MKIRPLENHSKITEIQSRLSKYPYLSKQQLPGTADAYVFKKLQAVQRIPDKNKSFNFYHWYILIKQFAPSAIEKWIKNDQTLENDKLISQIITLIESQSKSLDTSMDYVMDIFVKEPIQNNITSVKNKLLTMDPKQIGNELKVNFKNYQQRVNEYSDASNELRILFRLQPQECEKLKDIVSKWNQVENIQIKKDKKQRKQ